MYNKSFLKRCLIIILSVFLVFLKIENSFAESELPDLTIPNHGIYLDANLILNVVQSNIGLSNVDNLKGLTSIYIYKNSDKSLYKKYVYIWSNLANKSFLQASGSSILQPIKLSSNAYTIKACIDATNLVSESDEDEPYEQNNNCYEANLGASALSVTESSTIGSQQAYIIGDKSKILGTFDFEANQFSDVTVNSILLTVYTNNFDYIDSVQNLVLYDHATGSKITNSANVSIYPAKTTASNMAWGQALFEKNYKGYSLSIPIKKNQTLSLDLKGDFSMSLPAGIQYQFSIAYDTDVKTIQSNVDIIINNALSPLFTGYDSAIADISFDPIMYSGANSVVNATGILKWKWFSVFEVNKSKRA